MKFYTYVITRDYGFAPNPFGGYCTLATCKPSIRKVAQENDWVFGTGPKTSYNKPGHLFYAMKVEKKLTFNEYWDDEEFLYKKPLFNGSLKQCFGDNIYFLNEERIWHQQNSHHSFENGVINKTNLNTDTSAPFVLISTHFYYFGKAHIEIPEKFKENLCHNVKIPTYKEVEGNVAIEFIKWLEGNYDTGIHGDPMEFDNGFKRFKG